MASRTYREEVVGPQSTNRFVVPRTFPTTVVTGATTKAASAQPNLTGRPKKIDPVQDTAGGTPPGGGGVHGVGDDHLTGINTVASKVDTFGEFLASFMGMSPTAWGAEIGLFGKGAQQVGRDIRGGITKGVNTITGQHKQEEPLKGINPNRPPTAPDLRAEKNSVQQSVLDATGLDISSADQTSAEGGLAGLGVDSPEGWQ